MRHSMKDATLASALACLCGLTAIPVAGAGVDSNTPGYFPFVISPLDGSNAPLDMSFLNKEPAGASGRVTIHEGHFVDAHGKRVRLLGSNLTFAGAFPDKDLAPQIAAHLRKLGMNVIRFHHMDGRVAPNGIWEPGYRELDAQQLDRLDWLIYQLKQHGIFTNLNLHVSRTYPSIPKDVPRAFRYGKGLDNFVPEFIALQKQYAKMLLTHFNPYTKTTYAKEPAVIVVELNNENSLTDKSWNDLRQMPAPFKEELTGQWHGWLKQRYQTTAALRSRWNEEREPLGAEMLTNGDFATNVDHWTLEQGSGGKMNVQVVADSATRSRRAVEVKTQKKGRDAWSLQFHQRGLDLQARRLYTLRYRARSDQPRRIAVNVRLDQAPWINCGLNTTILLNKEYQQFVHIFRCVDPVPQHVRVSFNFNNQIGTFHFADISLRPGGQVGLGDDQSLENGTIPIAPVDATESQKTDFYQFLSDTECRYVRDMKAYLKEGLGVEACICDSQVSYGRLLGMYREGTLSDFMDMHAYWQHPHFPGKPWDGNDWTIPNTSMVTAKDGGTFASRAWYRMADTPFTVSEYDHPAPNDYAAELFPMLASFGAFQDWDGLYQFTYSSRKEGYDEAKIKSYFELCCHPGKKALVPIAAIMFRMGTVKAGENPLLINVPTDSVAAHQADFGRHYPPAGLRAACILRPVGFRLTDGAATPVVPRCEIPDGERISSTGQIQWDARVPKRASYLVNAPAVRVAIGFIGGRDITLADAAIRVERAEGHWACVAIGALDGKPLAKSSKILIAAVGRTENSGMGWNRERTSVGTRWGDAPTVVEGIGATIRLPAGTSVTALDGRGQVVRKVPFRISGRSIEFTIGPQYQTLWYLVTR